MEHRLIYQTARDIARAAAKRKRNVATGRTPAVAKPLSTRRLGTKAAPTAVGDINLRQVAPSTARGAIAPQQAARGRRGAEARKTQQSADRAANLLDRGVGIPTRGKDPLVDELRSLERFADIGEAEAQAQLEFQQTGTVTPETQSSIDLFKNPSLLESIRRQQAGQLGDRTGADVLADLQGIAEGGQVRTDRAAPGEPLQDPTSGAGGVPGQQGFSPEGQFQTTPSTPGQFEVKGDIFTGEGLTNFGTTEEQEDRVKRFAAGKGFGGVKASAADISQFRQNIIDQNTRKREEATRVQDAAQKKADKQAATSEAAAGAQQTSETVDALSNESLLNEILGILPDTPTAQALGASLRNSLQVESEIRNFQGRALGARQDSADDLFFDIEDRLAGQSGRAQKTFNEIEGKYENSLDSKNKLFAIQQKNDLDELAFLEEKQTRVSRKALRKQLDSNTVVMALMGRAGSVSANNELTQAEFDGEQAILDMQREIGFKRADVRSFYTGKYIEAQDTMMNAWYTAKDKLDTELGRIEGQGITNTQLRQQTIDGAFDKFVDEYTTSRREGAKIITSATNTVVATIAQEKEDVAATESVGWDRIEWAAKTYGSNTPQAIIDSIQAIVPSLDVKSALSTMTLAEINKKKTSGGGLGGFPSYMVGSTGEAPTFDNFLIQKEKETFARGADIFDTSKAAMKRYREEYDARSAASDKLNPTTIVNRFKNKAGLLSASGRKYSEGVLKEYINSGQLQLASDFVDNTGDDIPATQSDDFIQALNARYNVKKMQTLFDEIGTTFPGVGLIRNLNPLDDRVIQYKQNLIQTIPGLARGIFKEVGVLTDTDIDRYTSSMANPSLTQAQARTSFNDLVDRIDVSMQNQIGVWDANGKRVKGFRDLYESEPLGVSDLTETVSGTTQADEDFARSVLEGS